MIFHAVFINVLLYHLPQVLNKDDVLTWKSYIDEGMAAYGWALPDDIEKKARYSLNEVPERRSQDIQAVRDQIVTRPDIGIINYDI